MDYNVLLHPYRFLIVTALNEKNATIKELREMLPDIPQAAMYRSVQKLEEAGIIIRISETKIRGAVEATYKLNFSMEKMRLEDETAEAFMRAAYVVFFSYVHHKLAEHKSPLNPHDNLQLAKFNTAKIRIRRDRLDDFVKDATSLMQKYHTEDGDIYQLTTFLVPESKGGQ